MARWVRIFNRPFVGALVALVGSAFGLGWLRDAVLGCTVGFRTSGQPLTASQAAQCPTYDIVSAILIAVGLVAGGVLIWLVTRFFKAHSPASPEEEGRDAADGTGRRAAPSRLSSRLLAWPEYRWVCVLVALFFGAVFFAQCWAYLRLSLVSDDLLINQQLISSAVWGGKPYPFYESFTCGSLGYCSLLQEHQAFLAYPVAFVYGVAPTPFTLFAVQSLALGLGALPLYALASDVTGSRRLSLVVVGAYLVWLPLFYDAARDTFHWEAFIPVEMLMLFWLWYRQQYLWAIPVLLLAFITLEVTPVLTFAIGVFFFWPWLVKSVRLFLHAVFGGSARPRSAPSKLRLWGRWIRKGLHVPEVYAALALMVGSLAAYLLLRLFALHSSAILGVPPAPSYLTPPFVGGIPLNRDLVPSFRALSFEWTSKLSFWIVLYLSLGFIPLFAPRTFLLILPWMAYTVFNESRGFWILEPHVFVSVAAIIIGFTFGLNQLYRWTLASATDPPADSRAAANPSSGVATQARHHRPSPSRPWTIDGSTPSGSSNAAVILSAGVVIIIAGNLFLNPLNPLSASIVPNLGPPFPRLYGTSYTSFPDDQPLQQLASVIPANAVVAAPVSVFTYVADDPYAWPIAGHVYNVSRLPGHEANRTEYVLLPLDTPQGDFSRTLLPILYNRADFGVRGCVAWSAKGAVELFQRNYTGAPETFGSAAPLCPNYYTGGTGLAAGPFATILDNASSPSGVVVRSTPCAANGLIWTGPGIVLPPGRYGLHVVYNVMNTTGTSCGKPFVSPRQPVLSVNATGENTSGFETILQASFLERSVCSPACGGWHDWYVKINLRSTTSDFSINGTLLVGQYIVQVAYLVFSTAPP